MAMATYLPTSLYSGTHYSTTSSNAPIYIQYAEVEGTEPGGPFSPPPPVHCKVCDGCGDWCLLHDVAQSDPKHAYTEECDDHLDDCPECAGEGMVQV